MRKKTVVGEESASGFVCGLYLCPFKILESSLQNRTRDILEQQILQKPTEITEMAKEKWLCLKLGHPPVDHPCSSMFIHENHPFPQSPEPQKTTVGPAAFSVHNLMAVRADFSALSRASLQQLLLVATCSEPLVH